MASAVLASRNESNWGQSGAVFMGKQLPSSFTNHHHNLNPNPSPNPNNHNSIPKKKKKKQFANGHHRHDTNGVVSPPAVTQAASDDAYSFNQRPIDAKSAIDRSDDAFVSFDIGSCTRHELFELKKRLVAELEQIQRLNERIESGGFDQNFRTKTSRKLSGNKRPGPSRELPVVSPSPREELVPQGKLLDGNELLELMKMCRGVLTKLMMHKSSWIFKTPVDAAALGLHDYHQIVKRPMDLGTVKSNFSKNLYGFPGDFAADVRLVFENAILYNPKGDEVHRIAGQLLDRFEELYGPIQDRLKGGNDERDERNERNERNARYEREEEVQGSSWNHNPPAPENAKKKKPKPNSIPTPKEKIEVVPAIPAMAMPSSPLSNPSSPNPPIVQSPELGAKGGGGGRGSYVGKQPKPKARDPNKRAMSMEEKHKLGVGLQSLPEEKMPQLVQIIRKRNKQMAPEGDEIELDIEAIDTETLWELDRFVTNWKKMVSKNKRQALMTNNAVAPTASASGDDNEVVYMIEKTDAVKKPKKGEAGEEDVDIGDEMPITHFPPVEIEKDDGAAAGGGGHDNKGHATSSSSSSSGSSSDSSSSSDSESGSSSGSDSDADDAVSRGRENKEFSKS